MLALDVSVVDLDDAVVVDIVEILDLVGEWLLAGALVIAGLLGLEPNLLV